MNDRKRYMLFVGDYYYPQGPEFDKVGMFDSFDEAKSKASEIMVDRNCDWYDILDMDTGQFSSGSRVLDRI